MKDIGEVVISFGDFAFRGCRAQKKDEAKFDAFESPSYHPLAYITEKIDLQPICMPRSPSYSSTNFRPSFQAGVAQISLIPGLEPELFTPILDMQQCKGIILQSFGAGNVPHESEFSFPPFIKTASSKGIPVIVTSQFPANATTDSAYESGVEANEAGAIPTGNMTNSCAVAKFRWVLSKVEGKLARNEIQQDQKLAATDEMMRTIYIGEMD